VLALESRARRDPLIAIGIDLRESTWAADEAFPVFVLNVLQMVRRAGGALGPEQIVCGEPLSVRAPNAGMEVTVTTPSGERIARRARDGRADFLETGRTGFYRVEAGPRSAYVAANLLDRDETRSAPRPVRDAAGRTVVAEPAVAAYNREVWRWVAIAALLVLVVVGIFMMRTERKLLWQSAGDIWYPHESVMSDRLEPKTYYIRVHPYTRRSLYTLTVRVY
jgi:hypothetical protein